MSKNVCQYWSADEPVQCSYWSGSSCSNSDASYYPYCNNLGTQVVCSKYDGGGSQARCILPDPNRHVCNRGTGQKWQIDDINGYNGGNCDGAGTTITCSGYSPYHMVFSTISSGYSDACGYWDVSSKSCRTEYADGYPNCDGEGHLTTCSRYMVGGAADFDGFSVKYSDELPARLPYYSLVANNRARMSRCYWWKGNSTNFSISDAGVLDVDPYLCEHLDSDVRDKYSKSFVDANTGAFCGQCNGAKPECVAYTGVCWEYCIDDYMKQGDKIRSDQILELRYYLRGERWTKEQFESLFDDRSNIFAWTGSDNIEYTYNEDGTIQKALISAVQTSIEDFSFFNITRKTVILTEGTQVSVGGIPNYPTLVKYLDILYTAPIIRNKFSKFSNPDNKDDIIYDKNIFEVTSSTHEDVIIWGDVFYYNPTCYSFNLSDPDLKALFPNILFNFDSVLEIKTSLSDESYQDFYVELTNAIALANIIYIDKVGISEFGLEDGAFYIPTKTFFGENNIFVFSNGGGTWEYDKVSFDKILVGGVVVQTKFEVNGDGGTVSYLPNYEMHFLCNENNNDEMLFEFVPIVNNNSLAPSLSYIYNDSVVERLPSPPSFSDHYYDVGYKLYKTPISNNNVIVGDDLIFFGNAGYCMLRIEGLNCVHGAPDIEDITLSTHGNLVEMEVVEVGSDRIEVDQVFLKPTDILNFKRPCKNDGGITYTCNVYSKHSYADGEGEVVRESWLPQVDEDNTGVSYKLEFDITVNGNTIRVTNIGKDSLVLSCVYNGPSGLPKGIIKTKPLVWVKQPFCRDVEILYKWGCTYEYQKMLPDKVCNPDAKGFVLVNGNYGGVYKPWCGDHDLNAYTGIGPMWYPYHACEGYDVYRGLSAGGEAAENKVMEVFSATVDPDTGEEIYEHGDWDLRMMGPSDNVGQRGEGYTSIWACSCDFTFYTGKKIGDNKFSGKGAVRCGLSAADIMEMTTWGGEGPQFGNPHRDFLRSYRSFDAEYFYYIEIGLSSYVLLKKWMPAPYQFGLVDITSAIGGVFPFKLLCSDDYESVIQDKSVFIHPLSVLRANNIDGVDISEVMETDSNGNNVRVRYEDILEGHSNIGWLNYPKPVINYYAGVSLTPVKAYYTYKIMDDGSIPQFVWRENWKKIIRNYNVENTIDNIPKSLIAICCDVDGFLTEDIINFPYNSASVGRHLFMDISYPDYKYSANLDETRIVCEEGSHIMHIAPPSWKKDESDDSNPVDVYFWCALDNGLWRPFSIDNGFNVSNEAYYTPNPDGKVITTYLDWWNDSRCSKEAVLWDISFDQIDDAIEYAENNGLYIEIYNSTGDEVKEYAMSGINAVIKDIVNYLPTKTSRASSYEATKVGGVLFNGDIYGQSFDCSFDVENNSAEIRLIVPYSEGEGLVTCMGISFDFGKDSSNEYIYYIPNINVKVDGDNVFECESSLIAGSSVVQKDCMYYFNSSSLDIYNKLKDGGITIINLTLTIPQIVSNVSASYKHLVKINAIHLYHTIFVRGSEPIYTYERKYVYSKSYNCGDAGFAPSEVLTVPSYEGSTVDIFDNSRGIVGRPGTTFDELITDNWKTIFYKTVDKNRGRIMGAVFADKDVNGNLKYKLTGDDVREWETYQKEIYDNLIEQAEIFFTMDVVLPPGFETVLEDCNANISFGRNSTFKNTLLGLLAQPTPQETYSPCGYTWMHRNDIVSNIYGYDGLRCADHVWRDVLVQYEYVNPCTGSNALAVNDALIEYGERVWKYIFIMLAEGWLYTAPNIQAGIGKYWASVNTSQQTPPKVNNMY